MAGANALINRANYHSALGRMPEEVRTQPFLKYETLKLSHQRDFYSSSLILNLPTFTCTLALVLVMCISGAIISTYLDTPYIEQRGMPEKTDTQNNRIRYTSHSDPYQEIVMQLCLGMLYGGGSQK